MGNEVLKKARENKNDEFYTLYEDIENELNHYKDLVKGKSIYCPADTLKSNFWKFFYNNFNELGITKLTITGLNSKLYSTNDGAAIEEKELETNGDFLNDEILEIMRAHDIIITNPPFSLLCEFIKKLCENKIYFLLVGNENCYDNTRVFPYILTNEVKVGFTKPRNFITPDGTYQRLGNIQWITNLSIVKENQLKLSKTYSETEYKQYDNYEAINVDRVADIPIDYEGVMGVPITYISKHNPSIFKILGNTKRTMHGIVPYIEGFKDHGGNGMVEGKLKYSRIFIQRIQT